MASLDDKTIQDFDEQWSRYSDNEGWYGSLGLFEDITKPLLDPADLKGSTVIDIGSGTGRIVGMILAAGAERVFAIEPAPGAFQKLKDNVAAMDDGEKVHCLNARGDDWEIDPPADYVFSIGVIQFISDPQPVIHRCLEQLKPGGKMFIWLYSFEGNELYLSVILLLRKITVILPHYVLRLLIELLYGAACLYRYLGRLFPLPLRSYIDKVWWPMSPRKRRLVIYDQLNPTYAKYHKREEAIAVLEDAGFTNVRTNHRHGYSWCVVGEKPAD